MRVTAAPAAPTGAPASPSRPSHLWQVDIVRLLTFAAVIGVHVIAFTEQPDNRVAAGIMMMLQFGRELFFALTGFVLVYSAGRRPVRVWPFWRKRILYVAVPYVTWSAIYYFYFVAGPEHARFSARVFALDLLDAQAWYHLYFLLVTLQLYLVFPVIQRFVLKTARHAVPVLVAVGAVNLAWMGALAYVRTPSGDAGWLWNHAYILLPTYLMYVLAGCYAALHLERIEALFKRRPGLLLAVAGVSAGGALLAYALQLGHMPPRQANGVLQPAMALSCLSAAIVVYTIGSRWAAGPRRRQRLVETLSDASFGVYLAHPFILLLLVDFAGFGNDGQRLPPVAATVLGYVITAGGAAAVSILARRTPLSLALSGRPWRHPAAVDRTAPADRSPAMALAGGSRP